jgi:hypothetical protein
MSDYQNDKYENFFLKLRTSREGLVQFAAFTATAVAAPGVEAFIAGHGAQLNAALATLSAELVARQGQGGSSQSSTNAEETAFSTFKTFLIATEAKVLRPYFYDHAAERPTYYPDNLSGLTQALLKHRLTRLTAYTEALEKAPDATLLAQAPTARALLTQYEQARATKTKARTALQRTIGKLGPAAVAVAEALWEVDTAARYTHRRTPMQARRYFDYASLPSRAGAPRKPAAAQVA